MSKSKADDRGRGSEAPDEGEYGELLKFTLAGLRGGLALGAVLDWLGFQRSGWGQWLVRTLAGEGESVFAGIPNSPRMLSRMRGRRNSGARPLRHRRLDAVYGRSFA